MKSQQFTTHFFISNSCCLCADIKERNQSFGTSLLLANIGPNSPMTPKIVNGSHLALFDHQQNAEVLTDFTKKIDSMKKEIEGQGDYFRSKNVVDACVHVQCPVHTFHTHTCRIGQKIFNRLWYVKQ